MMMPLTAFPQQMYMKVIAKQWNLYNVGYVALLKRPHDKGTEPESVHLFHH